MCGWTDSWFGWGGGGWGVVLPEMDSPKSRERPVDKPGEDRCYIRNRFF